MANAVQFRVNSSQFDAALKRYAALSRRTPAQVVNKKAYYIIRRAIWHTHKAEYAKMAHEIGIEARAVAFGTTKAGKPKVKRGKAIWANSPSKGAPLLALMIHARSKRGKHHGRYDSPWKGVSRNAGASAMLKAMKRIWGARARSIAYLKSGWITARDAFRRYSGGVGPGLPPTEGRTIRQLGRPKGSASVAVDDRWKARATFTNSASTKRDHKQALYLYAEPALHRAFAEETEDTMREVERRLRADANTCGIRTN